MDLKSTKPLPIYIHHRHVQALLQCSRATAFRKINEAKLSAGRLNAPLTIVDFCRYAQLDVNASFQTILKIDDNR